MNVRVHLDTDGSEVVTIDDIAYEIEIATEESDYSAVNTLWLALVKLANREEGNSEKTRMLSLVDRVPNNDVRVILAADAVDVLLALEPPLETISSNQHEKLETEKIEDAIESLRSHRLSAPRRALASLGCVLKVIRNKREHGFKSRLGARDSDILAPTRVLLDRLCRAALQASRRR